MNKLNVFIFTLLKNFLIILYQNLYIFRTHLLFYLRPLV